MNDTEKALQVPLSGRGFVAVLDPPEPAEPTDYRDEPYPAKRMIRYPWVLYQGIDNPDAILVLMVLVDHDKPAGSGIYPSYDRIQAFTTFRRQRIANALDHLERHGYIERERDHTGGRRRANKYRIRSPLDGALVRQADFGLVRTCGLEGGKV